MATKRPAFPNIRVWIIANNLNQRVGRPSRLHNPATHTWNAATRRMGRYFHFLLLEPRSSNPESATWRPYIAMLVRSLRRQSRDADACWQRRIFQILEFEFHLTKLQPPYDQRAWQVCFQILTSHNYWKRRKSPTSSVEQAWQHTLWRAAHLKKRFTADPVIPATWAICFRIILTDSLSHRTRAWGKIFTNLIQNRLIRRPP